MPCVEFKPTIPVSVRAKTVHALDRSAIVTSYHKTNRQIYLTLINFGAKMHRNILISFEKTLRIQLYFRLTRSMCNINDATK
jgi:hypothetical protein